MPNVPSFNAQMVAKLRALILKNPGVSSITVDGQTTSYVDLQLRLQQFEAELARETDRARFIPVNLGGFTP